MSAIPEIEKTGSVLVIEDNDALNGLFRRMLQSAGFAVEGVTSIEKARLHLQDSVPQVIILDIDLEDGNGLEIVRTIEELKHDDVKIVVVSGYAYSPESLALERIDYQLMKPVSPRGLMALVQMLQ